MADTPDIQWEGQKWGKQPWESAKAYASFCDYLEMGTSRTLEKLAKMQGRASPRWLGEWSTKYHWQERVAAYQAHLDMAGVRAQEEAHQQALQMYLSKQRTIHAESMSACSRILRIANSVLDDVEQGKIAGFEARDIPGLLRAVSQIADSMSASEARILAVDELLRLLRVEEEDYVDGETIEISAVEVEA